MQITAQLCFPIKIQYIYLNNSENNSNHVVNGLSPTIFLYILVKLNAFFLGQGVKLKTKTDFQINCNDHLIKSQSSIEYFGIDIDYNLSGERTTNTII